MRKRLLFGAMALLAGFAVAGASCDKIKNDPQAPAKTALLGCETVNSQLTILLPLREAEKLPQNALDVLDNQIEVTEPFCGGPAPSVNATWIEVTVDGAARTLMSIAAAYGSGGT